MKHPHNIISRRVHAEILILIPWPRQCLSQSLRQSCLSLSFHTLLLVSNQDRGWRIEREYLYKLFAVLCRRLGSFLPFSHLYQYIYFIFQISYGYLFYTSGSCYLVTLSVPVLAIGSSFRLAPVLCLFDMPPPFKKSFFSLSL